MPSWTRFRLASFFVIGVAFLNAAAAAPSGASQGKIDWVAVEAVGQIVGAVAVVISLLYLGAEIRQNALATRAHTAHDAVAALRDFNEACVADPKVERIFRLGAEGLSCLSQEERGQFAHLAFNFFKTAEDLHFQFVRGTLDKTVWEGWRNVLAAYGTSPGFREYWSQRPVFFTLAFQREYASWSTPDVDRVADFVKKERRP